MHSRILKIIPAVPPINEDGISSAGVRKCPNTENKKIETPVTKDVITNIFKFLFLKFAIFIMTGFESTVNTPNL